MPKQNKSVDLDFTGIFSKADFKAPPPQPIPLPQEVVIGANALKKGGYFVNLTHPRARLIASPSAATVLIVEDDPSTLVLLDRLLTRAGYRTRMASSGSTFVATMRTTVVPDLILLDLELPDVTGFKILTKVREHPKTKHVPVVILSARSEPGDVFEGLSLGADGYVTKPTKSSTLIQAVKAVLGV